MSGHDLVRQLEQLPVDRNSRPLQDAVINNCGELVRQVKGLSTENKNFFLALVCLAMKNIHFPIVLIVVKKVKDKKTKKEKSDDDSSDGSADSGSDGDKKKKKMKKTKKKNKKK